MNIYEYIETLNRRFKKGDASEHTYRGDLQQVLERIADGLDVTNEPKRTTDVGNPDYIISKGEIAVGFIEAKDIGKNLGSPEFKEQFERYKRGLDNLIITDYLTFLFYENGKLVWDTKIGEINVDRTSITPLEENFKAFENRIKEFCEYVSQTIKSPKRLAELMAGKARLLENIIEGAINADAEDTENIEENSTLQEQYKAFRNILIHDLSVKDFADIYAQTLAYGMFSARIHDETLDTFSRQEASDLIPKTNPFLRKLFDSIAGIDIDRRIKVTVDNLADVFRATDVKELLKNFGKSTQTQDPIIHFYETFLAKYDSALRRARGVWYTPEPIVNFIVRGIDHILKREFNLENGLADTSKTTINIKTDKPDRRKKHGYTEIQRIVHKVQILDPATGTGTFLAQIIKHIYFNNFENSEGAWSKYVEDDLIPRLNGFELLMASYSVAHLKLDMLLSETNYVSQKEQRFNIYLTNSLEEHHPDTGGLFSSWLSKEANEANWIKRDTPVMVVLGNPPL